MEDRRNVAEAVKAKIERRGQGTTLSYSDFRGLPFMAVAKALSRFAKDGWLTRVRKGVYFYPRKTALGNTFPKVADVLDKASWSHGMILVGSSSTASYSLGLTTQVPFETVLLGNYPNRVIDLAGTKVRTRRRDTAHLKNLGKRDIAILEAIRNLKKLPAVGPTEALKGLREHILKSDVKSLCHASLNEPPRVRALLGAILEERSGYSHYIEPLKRSLNPLSTYKFGLASFLSHAHSWGIR